MLLRRRPNVILYWCFCKLKFQLEIIQRFGRFALLLGLVRLCFITHITVDVLVIFEVFLRSCVIPTLSSCCYHTCIRDAPAVCQSTSCARQTPSPPDANTSHIGTRFSPCESGSDASRAHEGLPLCWSRGPDRPLTFWPWVRRGRAFPSSPTQETLC